ncbi:MAG TPA: polysaccharide deacetylase family protein [Solirubrobacteraceae bacterium]|nr:polysaccharide deacetylase family protein [Solirubrobacteraceae bacterium]
MLVLSLAGCAGQTSTVSSTSARRRLPPPLPPVVLRPAPRRAGGATLTRLLRLGLPIYCAGRRGHDVAFTFDDGPGVYTSLAIRKLARAHERATFFVVGRSMDQYHGYLRRELRVAAIGDHTYTHPILLALSPSQITWQLEATARKIEAQTRRRVDLWRPPYELHNATTDRIAQRLGLVEILWDVDSQDSLGAGYAQIIKHVEAGLHPGAIIEMHENRGQTIRALTTLLPLLHRRHLRSVSVLHLLGADPPSVAQVRRGLLGCGGAARHARSAE